MAVQVNSRCAYSPMAYGLLWALALLALAASITPIIISSLGVTIGHLSVDSRALSRYARRSPLNGESCMVVAEADACEDVKIHYASQTAFIACGDPAGREKWYPPSNTLDSRARQADTWRESLFRYDIRSNKTTKLQIIGASESWDFISHGIDIWNFHDDPTRIHIFAVNHGRGGDSISIFEHILGEDTIRLVKDIRHKNIRNVNGVAASGPWDFFFTSDRYFSTDFGWLRRLEGRYGPWSWSSHVQNCNANGPQPECRQVSQTFPGANGIAIWEDEIYLADVKTGEARIFKIGQDRTLRSIIDVDLGGQADNVNVIPSTGDLMYAVFPVPERLDEYLHSFRELGRSKLVPACAVRLVRSRGFEPELVYWNDGSVLSHMTAMAFDPASNVLIGTAVLQYGGFAICNATQAFR